jgi:hypothetical protein
LSKLPVGRVGAAPLSKGGVALSIEATLAQNTYGFAPADVGKPDIHDHEIDLTSLGGLYGLGSIVDRD